MSSGGGYSGGMGGFGGGFGSPPMFGGGFGQQFPSYGGGFGAFGPQPYSGFGGGFGGGFGQPQPPQFGGGFDGGFDDGFGQPQPPQFGGGFRQFQPPQFGGGFGQRGPGNAYAKPFPQKQPQPAPLPQQQTPPPGMELNPDYIDRFANGQIGTMDYRPSDRRFRPIQQPFDSFEVRPAVMPEVPTDGGYPSRDQFSGNTQTFFPTIEPTPAQPALQQGSYSPYMNQPFQSGLSGMLSSGLGGMFGGYQAMPFGGFQGMFNKQPQQQSYGSVQGNMNNPAYQQQLAAENMTDYQRLMRKKNMASAGPYVNPLTGAVGGVNPFLQVSDYEIAKSLGFQDPYSKVMGAFSTHDYRPERDRREREESDIRAKEYLDKIGYGTEGFDSSKYEVKREVQPFSDFGSLFSGLGRGFA